MNRICATCKQDKPVEAYRATRKDCRECERAKHRAWYARQEVKPCQRDDMKAYWKKWYEDNKESVKKRASAWAKSNPVKRGAIVTENMRRQRVKLCNAYVRRMLAQDCGLKSRDIPQQLVDVQRELLKLKRELRK